MQNWLLREWYPAPSGIPIEEINKGDTYHGSGYIFHLGVPFFETMLKTNKWSNSCWQSSVISKTLKYRELLELVWDVQESSGSFRGLYSCVLGLSGTWEPKMILLEMGMVTSFQLVLRERLMGLCDTNPKISHIPKFSIYSLWNSWKDAAVIVNRWDHVRFPGSLKYRGLLLLIGVVQETFLGLWKLDMDLLEMELITSWQLVFLSFVLRIKTRTISTTEISDGIFLSLRKRAGLM